MNQILQKLHEACELLTYAQNRQIKAVEEINATSALLDRAVDRFNEIVEMFNKEKDNE